MVLLYLGAADLGPTPSQPIYAVSRDGRLTGRLTTSDTVTQYGRGYATFASGVFGTPTAQPAQGLGTYRSARFTPSSISGGGYSLTMNDSKQVGHGGDSGGPTWVTVDGRDAGIAGVQSTCAATSYVRNTPPGQQAWKWATGISWCGYVATDQFRDEIAQAITERPTLL